MKTIGQVAVKHNKGLYERIRFRWEILRMLPQYRADYQKALKLRKDSGKPPEDVLKSPKPKDPKDGCNDSEESPGDVSAAINYEYSSTPEWKQEQELCREYGLTTRIMPNPDKSFEQLFGKPPEIIEDRVQHSVVDFIRQKNIFNMQPKCISHKVQQTEITFKIDLSKVNSIHNLKSYISEILDVEYKRLPHDSTFQPPDLDMLARTGPLYEQGLRGQDLAEALFPEAFVDEDSEEADPSGGSKEAALKRASRWVKYYKHMRDGGWRRIQFP